jgi:hypothetical protein
MFCTADSIEFDRLLNDLRERGLSVPSSSSISPISKVAAVWSVAELRSPHQYLHHPREDSVSATEKERLGGIRSWSPSRRIRTSIRHFQQ